MRPGIFSCYYYEARVKVFAGEAETFNFASEIFTHRFYMSRKGKLTVLLYGFCIETRSISKVKKLSYLCITMSTSRIYHSSFLTSLRTDPIGSAISSFPGCLPFWHPAVLTFLKEWPAYLVRSGTTSSLNGSILKNTTPADTISP